MKQEHKLIIDKIIQFLEAHPQQRFGQALFNLGINEFQESTDSLNPKFYLRDIYHDKDSEISKRMEGQLEWFDLQSKVSAGLASVVGIQGMIVNERLSATDLMDSFNQYKNSKKEFAAYILKALKVDSESIKKILS